MKKLILLIPFIFLISLFSVIATKDCNLTIPNSNQVGNLTVFNVSVNASAGETRINVSLWANSVSTRNSTLIGNVTNTSNLLHVNFTFPNSMIVEDSTDYSVWATCYGGGTLDSQVNSSVVSNVLFDRTKPAPPTGITYTNPVQDGNTITSTINLALANRCWIRFGSPTAPRKAMTLSGSTCTFTAGRDNPPNSDYQTYLSADDRTNETLSTVQNVIIRTTQSDGGGLFGDTIVQDGSLTKAGGAFNKVDNKTIAFILILSLFLLYLKNKK